MPEAAFIFSIRAKFSDPGRRVKVDLLTGVRPTAARVRSEADDLAISGRSVDGPTRKFKIYRVNYGHGLANKSHCVGLSRQGSDMDDEWKRIDRNVLKADGPET